MQPAMELRVLPQPAAMPAPQPPPAPPTLPTGWQELWSPDHRRYYYHHQASHKTQWTRPAAEAERGSAEDLERLEGVTMMRLRQASERQKLAEAMRAEEAAAAEPSQPT